MLMAAVPIFLLQESVSHRFLVIKLHDAALLKLKLDVSFCSYPNDTTQLHCSHEGACDQILPENNKVKDIDTLCRWCVF